MAKEERSLRNAIIVAIVTVAVTAAIPIVRDWMYAAVVVVWSGVRYVGNLIAVSYPIPGWALVIVAVLAIPSVVAGFRRLRTPAPARPENSYFDDDVHSVTWRWRYAGHSIIHLLAFCPVCDSQLVYEHVHPDATRYRLWQDEPQATRLHCEHCSAVRAKMPGGRDYAWGAVEREIQRRIRTGEWRQRVADRAARVR